MKKILLLVSILFLIAGCSEPSSSGSSKPNYNNSRNSNEQHMDNCFNQCIKSYDPSDCVDVMGDVSGSVDCDFNDCFNSCI